MSRLIRFGVSLELDLLRKFDSLLKEMKSTSRSEALRDLIRRVLVKKQWWSTDEIAGAIIVVYDHHKKDPMKKLLDIQHDSGRVIILSQHVHLAHNSCLEVITIKGSPRVAQELADRLKSNKGVKHRTLSMSTSGRGLWTGVFDVR